MQTPRREISNEGTLLVLYFKFKGDLQREKNIGLVIFFAPLGCIKKDCIFVLFAFHIRNSGPF